MGSGLRIKTAACTHRNANTGEQVTRVSGAYQDNKGRVFIGSYMHHVQHISVLDLEPNLQP